MDHSLTGQDINKQGNLFFFFKPIFNSNKEVPKMPKVI